MRLIQEVRPGRELKESTLHTWVLSNVKRVHVKEVGQDNIYSFAATIDDMMEMKKWVSERDAEHLMFKVIYFYE